MLHARTDYARIQDPDGLIPQSEPVFLLRGQDVFAPDSVRLWADQAETAGASPEIVASARAQADRMDRWQADIRGGKIPDMPAGAGVE